MKKVLSLILALIMLVMLPVEILAADVNESEDGFIPLPANVTQSAEIRQRKKVDGLRLYVDEENPLFMIRNCPRYLPNPTPFDIAFEAVVTFWALPEDIKPFAVIYIDEGPTYLNPQQQLDFWNETLNYTDEYNVPVVLQSECFCTNKEREPFTQEQLSSIFEAHESMMGYVQVELSTNGVTNEHLATDVVTNDMGVNKNILARIKSCVKSCAENGGLFIWQDMEYTYWKKNNYVNHILKDRELYDLLKSNKENIIIMDKHNGHGRHFASQSNILGCWLDDVCGNWGVNLENFLWYEEGFTEYDSVGLKPNEPDFAYTAKYPPALYGIDLISDIVAGATVFSIEGTLSRGGLYHFINDQVYLTPTFHDVLYPFFRMALDGCVPSKEQVKEKIKVGFKMNFPAPYALSGNDARLLQGLYCDKFTFVQEYFDTPYLDCSKTWVPSTGRYHVIPILPIYSNPEEVLPDSYILDDWKYFINLLFINPIKERFFNERYEETYEGNGVLFDINDYIYVFNSNENKITDSEQTVKYTLPESNKKLNAEFVAHTYAVFKENGNNIDIDLCNLRLDSDKICAGLESEHEFMCEYATGGKIHDPKNFRESVITLSGYETEPEVVATGSNNAKMKTEFDAQTGTLTISVISNGEVRINVKGE
ncbi:MAG: hypothetical protein IJ279_00080 [Clostridia bacterium]|nr:hypothetical protein [Clostridia bacterium]